MNVEILVVVLLGVLILLAGVEAIQLVRLSEKVKSINFNTAKPSSSGGNQVPSNLQNLPQMVGGC